MKNTKRTKITLALAAITAAYSLNATAVSVNDSYINMEKVSYADATREETNNSDSLGLSLDKDFTKDAWKGKFDFQGKFFLNNESPAYSIQEMYISHDNDNRNLTVGRQILDWNENEEFWQLSHLNGLSNIDFLDNNREGLFGINYSVQKSNIKIDAFLSYFYLPSLNPSLEVQDGKVINNGSWGRTPPQYTAIADVKTPIVYDVNTPATEDVIFKKSLGGRLSYVGDVVDASVFAIYKPETTLRINAEAYANLDATVSAIANPMVNHHGLYGASFNIGKEAVRFNNSIHVVDPNVNLAGDFEVVDPFKLEQDSRKFSSRFFTVKPNYQKQTYLTSQLNVKSADQEIGLYGIYLLEGRDSLGDDFLSDAPKWHVAAGLSGKFRYHHRWLASGSFQYDFDRHDQILKFNTNYFFAAHSSVGIGGKLLRSPKVQSYWYPHRAEDQIFFTLQQAF